jgi:predicted nucleic-acid-binding protein
MIAIDTNVLLRRILRDDALQAQKADKLFEKHKAILITDVVLVETIWTLRGKKYGASKETIQQVIMSLLEEAHVIFENQQAVWSALNDYISAKEVKTPNGMKELDFSDALIINKAKIVMAQWGEPYEATYTFDKAAQSVSGARAL